MAELARSVKDEAPLGVTDLGRVAALLYIDHETIAVFNASLKQYMPDSELLHTLCQAHEFEQPVLALTHTHTHDI